MSMGQALMYLDSAAGQSPKGRIMTQAECAAFCDQVRKDAGIV